MNFPEEKLKTYDSINHFKSELKNLSLKEEILFAEKSVLAQIENIFNAEVLADQTESVKKIVKEQIEKFSHLSAA